MAIFDVRGFDNDGADHSNDFNPVTDEGWFTPADFAGVSSFFLKHYNSDESQEIGATGTGLFNPFLNMNGDSTLLGFNTNDDIKKPYTDAGLDISDPNTDAIQLGDIPIVYRDLDGNGIQEAYYLINLDINESNATEVSLEELQIYTSSASAVLSDYHFDEGAPLAFANNGGDPATDFILRFNLDASDESNELTLRDDGAGQGKLDYTFYFPVSMFAGASPNDYVTLFSQFGPTPPDDAGFAEWNVLNAAKISGIKFKDVNGNGLRDIDGVDNILGNADDEVGLAGFTMYIDLNGNNKLDTNEQTALTDATGAFQFASLLPNASYVIREVLTVADVNGPGDAGPDVVFTDFDPPAGAWIQTTDPLNDGDQIVNVTTGTTNILVGNFLAVPDMSITKSVVSVTNGNDNGTPLVLTDDKVDGADNVINYSIIVTNTGNVTLTGLLSDDEVEALGKLGLTAVLDGGGHNAGDTNDNFAFDPGEAWQFTASYDVSQADIDNNGGGDGILSNIARARSDQTSYIQDDALVPIVYDPAMNVTKSVVSVTNGDDNGTPLDLTDDQVDGADNIINYSITIANTGNVTLTGVTVTDEVEAYGAVNATFVSGDTDSDGDLDVGETWTYSASYDVTQDDIDNNGGGNGFIDNVATGDTIETPEDTDDAAVPILLDPAMNVTKSVVSVTNGNDNGTPLDLTDDQVDGADNIINYSITIANTGNIALTGVTVTDEVEAYGAVNATYVSGDGNTNNILDVGETWTYSASYDVTQDDIDNNGGGNGFIDNVATGDTIETPEDTDDAAVPILLDPAMNVTKSVVSVTNGNDNGTPLDLTDDQVDGADNIINYSITIANTGNVVLTGVTVTDEVEAYGAVNATFVSGDTDGDGDLDVGETWTYSASYDVTQDDIDNNGGGNGFIDNVATGDTIETPEDTDDAAVPILLDPAMNVTKSVVSVTNGDDNGTPLDLTDDQVDGADNIINYSITIANTGNIALTGVTVTDEVEAYGAVNATYVSGDGNTNNILDVGETWTYSASYDVTQDDIDNNGGGNGFIDNVATGDTEETDEDTDDASVAIIRDPAVALVKNVKTDQSGGVFVSADDPNGPLASTSSTVDFQVIVTNTGNVTLTGVHLTDTIDHNGLETDDPINYTTVNAQVDLHNDGTIDGNWSDFDTNNDGILDDADGNAATVDDFSLAVGDSFAIYYSLDSALGQHENTAVVTTTQGENAEDDANYYVVESEDCVGVRTPGFWANSKWGLFWNYNATDQDALPQAGQPNFPGGELLYAIDTNEDGVINGSDTPNAGLLIGDYNKNGITDLGADGIANTHDAGEEDTLFISLADAKTLINASNKQLNGNTGDGMFMLGRDVVATWLNYLSNNPDDSVGNCIGDVNSGDGTNTPREFLDAAIDWLQQFASDQNSNQNNNLVNSYHDGDTQAKFQFDSKISPSSGAWQNPFLPGEDIPVSAAAMHAALDGYNNTGTINGVEYCCDADSELVVGVLSQIGLI